MLKYLAMARREVSFIEQISDLPLRDLHNILTKKVKGELFPQGYERMNFSHFLFSTRLHGRQYISGMREEEAILLQGQTPFTEETLMGTLDYLATKEDWNLPQLPENGTKSDLKLRKTVNEIGQVLEVIIGKLKEGEQGHYLPDELK